MNDDELHALVEELEAGLRQEARAALTLTAQDFATAVHNADELVAAAFGVSRIGAMWRRRVGGLVESLRRIARRGAVVTAEDLQEPLPSETDTSEFLDPYFDAVRTQLSAVGDRISERAVTSLREGIELGETQDELKQRMLAVFSEDGTQLGGSRAQRIAMTEATSAFNAGVLAAAQALTGPDRPLVKQWVTRRDTAVRSQHRDADGQLQLLDDPFDVAGVPMQYPGDPTAPPNLSINCRCVTRVSAAPTATASANGRNGVADDLTAADGVHTGAMIALMPTAEDAERLTLDGDGAEPTNELHLTLWFLGDAAPWTDDQRNELIGLIRARAATLPGPIRTHAFGVNHWNPGSEDPAWVWAVGDDRDAADDAATLHEARNVLAVDALESTHERPETPHQHSPWVAHVTGVYTTETWPLEAMAERLGPITFDRVRIAFAGDHTDIPLGQELETAAMDDDDLDMPYEPPAVTWSTPDGTALAFENQQTGDSRVFTPGALYWDGTGPWPLKLGHDAETELAGAIHGMGRDGDRIAAHGVLYPATDAGWEAATLLAQGAPLGVSVDLDDVDYEVLVSEDSVAYKGRLVTASVLPLSDGYIVKGQTAAEVHASADCLAATSVSRTVTFRIDADGLVAAAGDGAWTEGAVVDEQKSGDLLMRITRARIRGASLVTIPAFANARIVIQGHDTMTSWDQVNVSAAVDSPSNGKPLEGATATTATSASTGGGNFHPSQNNSAGIAASFPASRNPDAAMTASASSTSSARPTVGPQTPGYTQQQAASTGPQTRVAGTPASAASRPSTASRKPSSISSSTDSSAAAPSVDDNSKTWTTSRDRQVRPTLTTATTASKSEASSAGTATSAWAASGTTRLPSEQPPTTWSETKPFAVARIVLDDPGLFADGHTDEAVTAAINSTTDYDRVLRHVRRSNQPVGAARLAQFLKMPLAAAQRLLAYAASRGEVVRLTRGLYTDKTTSAKADHVMMDDMVASVTGSVDLPVAPRGTEWDGDAAARRVIDWADGACARIERAFMWRDDSVEDCTQRNAWKLGVADVIDGTLAIIPKGVSAAIGAVNGARGGVDIPENEINDVRARLEEVRTHVSEETGGEESEGMQASAWKAMQDLPPMPAEWFREPTMEELPPGAPGVNYRDGRIFGWVAQAGEPHAGYAKKITIDGLGRIDTSHFLRQRFTLDDGTVVKAGAYTMNVGHHRDGAECETSACQFDDTRTVAGIVTVGMNERGMWFSGAAAPWMSDWDRRIFAATQPSYHMRKGPNGQWQLRAVLGVPVPGHSSPLLAAAVMERAQLALTAAATMVEANEAVAAEKARQEAERSVTPHDVGDVAPEVEGIDYDRLAAAIVVAQERREAEKAAEEAELAALLAEANAIVETITASAYPDTETITEVEN